MPEIYRRPAVERITGLSRSSIYSKLDQDSPYFDADFPRPIKLGKRAIGWKASDISAWLESREESAA